MDDTHKPNIKGGSPFNLKDNHALMLQLLKKNSYFDQWIKTTMNIDMYLRKYCSYLNFETFSAGKNIPTTNPGRQYFIVQGKALLYTKNGEMSPDKNEINQLLVNIKAGEFDQNQKKEHEFTRLGIGNTKKTVNKPHKRAENIFQMRNENLIFDKKENSFQRPLPKFTELFQSTSKNEYSTPSKLFEFQSPQKIVESLSQKHICLAQCINIVRVGESFGALNLPCETLVFAMEELTVISSLSIQFLKCFDLILGRNAFLTESLSLILPFVDKLEIETTIVPLFTEYSFNANQAIFSRNDLITHFYFLRQGCCELFIDQLADSNKEQRNREDTCNSSNQNDKEQRETKGTQNVSSSNLSIPYKQELSSKDKDNDPQNIQFLEHQQVLSQNISKLGIEKTQQKCMSFDVKQGDLFGHEDISSQSSFRVFSCRAKSNNTILYTVQREAIMGLKNQKIRSLLLSNAFSKYHSYTQNMRSQKEEKKGRHLKQNIIPQTQKHKISRDVSPNNLLNEINNIKTHSVRSIEFKHLPITFQRDITVKQVNTSSQKPILNSIFHAQIQMPNGINKPLDNLKTNSINQLKRTQNQHIKQHSLIFSFNTNSSQSNSTQNLKYNNKPSIQNELLINQIREERECEGGINIGEDEICNSEQLAQLQETIGYSIEQKNEMNCSFLTPEQNSIEIYGKKQVKKDPLTSYFSPEKKSNQKNKYSSSERKYNIFDQNVQKPVWFNSSYENEQDKKVRFNGLEKKENILVFDKHEGVLPEIKKSTSVIQPENLSSKKSILRKKEEKHTPSIGQYTNDCKRNAIEEDQHSRIFAFNKIQQSKNNHLLSQMKDNLV